MNYRDLQNNSFKAGACPKAGIKIHETNNNSHTRQNPNPNQIINQEMPKPDTKKQEELDTEIIEKSEGDADSYYDPTKL